MDALQRGAEKAFEDRTYAHINRYFPNHCALLGEAQVRRVINEGWRKATTYGFTAECCVRTYIEFMCLLGSGFDTDTLLPWARALLTGMGEQIARADRLYDKVWDYVSQISHDYRDEAGKPTTARFVTELRQVRYGGDEIVTPARMPAFLESLRQRLGRIFPAKCAYVGDGHVRAAVAESVQRAQEYKITSQRGGIVFTSMRFVLGGSFDNDLLLPWASATLKDPTITDQHERVDKLYAEGVSCLRQWWDRSRGES